MAKTFEIKELTEKTNDLVKNIWFAGLGVCSKAADEAQDQYGKVNSEVSSLFDELVSKGKKVEGDLQGKTTEIKEKSSTTLDERLAQVKSTLKFTSKKSAIDSQLADVSSKLDLVIKALEAKKTTKKAADSKAA